MSVRKKVKGAGRIKRGESRTGWFLISPYLVFGVVFFLIPLIWTLYLAFTDWNLISPKYEFVGISNFIEAISDAKVHKAFFTTYKFSIFPFIIIQCLCLAIT